MLSLYASSILFLAAIVVAICWRLRPSLPPLAAQHRLHDQLQGDLAALQVLVLLARQESARLETALEKAQSLRTALTQDTLEKLEELADPAALASPHSLAEIAAQLPPFPGAAADLFAANQKTLAIARLLDQGHATAEIARRLGLPLGEIELLISLRST